MEFSCLLKGVYGNNKDPRAEDSALSETKASGKKEIRSDLGVS